MGFGFGFRSGFYGPYVPAPNVSPGGYASLVDAMSDVGGTLLVDAYTPGNYTESGGALTSIKEVISDTALSINGTPQWGASLLNSGPAIDFNGTTDYILGSVAAAYNVWEDNAIATVIIVAQSDVADAVGALFSVGQAASNTGTRYFGQWDSVNGKMRMGVTNDAAGTTTIIGDDATSVATPAVWEITSNGTTATVKRNRVVVPGLSAQAFAPGATSPDRFGLACWCRLSLTQLFNGKISLVAGVPALLGAKEDDFYNALGAHHAAIGGLLP